MPGPESVISQSLQTGAQPNQSGQGCCAECYSQTLGTSARAINPIEVDDVDVVQICLPNPSRKGTILVNTGTTTIFIGLGFSPTALNYSFALPSCLNAANDGTGGIFVDNMWQGSLFAIGDNTGGTVNFTEMV